MLDAQQREIDYLRISVTDRCNLRCVYCMPETGVEPVSHRDILRFEEILRICRSAATLGVRRVRLTGGEPLARHGLAELVRGIHEIPGITEITMTTNGVLFGEQAQTLAAAGLTGVNVSLDTLDPIAYARITRRDGFAAALGAVDHALALGLMVKVNCVAAREFGLAQALAVAQLARERPVDVRYIEIMPIGLGDGFTAIPGAEIAHALAAAYGEPTACAGSGGGPARYLRLPGFAGRIGFINAMSDCFCAQCNRVRLTAEGFLKLCLHYDVGVDLREPLRAGLDDDTLTALLRAAIYQKPVGHRFGAEKIEHREMHKMVQIGG